LSSCYCHHLDVHSFPTRRSSDLQVTRNAGCAHITQIRAERQHEKHATEHILALGDPRHRLDPHWMNRKNCCDKCALPNAAGHSSDRKSTRLNSSHVSISYAVFCL